MSGINRQARRVAGAVALAAFGLLAQWAPAAPGIEISHQKPFNIFTQGQGISFTVKPAGFPQGETRLNMTVRDYFGREVWTSSQPAAPSAPLSADLGKLAPGYYELTVVASSSANGKETQASRTCSFGVASTVNRTAAEARDGNYRFGLKIFQIGEPGVWWRRPLQWNLTEAVDASAALGLQWTRHGFQGPSTEPGVISLQDLINKHPMNVVMKIEGIPDQAYDAARYGPREEYDKKNKKGWRRCTVPLKEPYQAWLKEQIAAIPPEQNVFEIGNEVWDYMSAEEFAQWCQMVVPVIREIRPKAVIGADPGSLAWGKRFLAAGGMQGMDMQVIHPYSFTPMPEVRVRAWLRNRRDFVDAAAGRKLDIYVTEYGWSTAPQDKRKQAVSERTQAQRTTRQSLMLYAEDCKTLIPHWMADREQDPTEREHWFGFFRLVGEPKPVVIAHAVCARMIDGSSFVGDLWYQPGIGAMLFRRGDTYTLALWTLDEELGKGRDLAVDVGVPQLKIVDIMGGEKTLATTQGKLNLKISSDMTYLVGVSPELARQATTPDQELNPDRWGQHLASAPLPRAATTPRIDASFADWAAVKPLELRSTKSPSEIRKLYLAWDQQCLYLAIQGAGEARVGDSLELRIGTRPGRQLSLQGWSLYDYTVQLSPPSSQGGATLQISNTLWDKPRTITADGDPSGARWIVKPAATGWSAEAAIPLSLLKGFPGTPGQRITWFAKLSQADKNSFSSAPIEVGDVLKWPYLVLEQ